MVEVKKELEDNSQHYSFLSKPQFKSENMEESITEIVMDLIDFGKKTFDTSNGDLELLEDKTSQTFKDISEFNTLTMLISILKGLKEITTNEATRFLGITYLNELMNITDGKLALKEQEICELKQSRIEPLTPNVFEAAQQINSAPGKSLFEGKSFRKAQRAVTPVSTFSPTPHHASIKKEDLNQNIISESNEKIIKTRKRRLLSNDNDICQKKVIKPIEISKNNNFMTKTKRKSVRPSNTVNSEVNIHAAKEGLVTELESNNLNTPLNYENLSLGDALSRPNIMHLFNCASSEFSKRYKESWVYYLDKPKVINGIRSYYNDDELAGLIPIIEGCARAQGYTRMSVQEKRLHIKRVELQEEQPLSSTPNIDLKILQRRLTQEFNANALKINPLSFRKKAIKFARSKIHGWGLFALEPIFPDEVIVEYVGEKIRTIVSDVREEMYEKRGIGSSYMFKLDDDSVVDATAKGNFARFINHCCAPNSYAKVLTVSGEKRVVLYCKKPIEKFEEITYDYKFNTEDEKIDCYCNAKSCKSYMN